MTSEQPHVLLFVEAEAYAEALEAFKITDIGNDRWSRQHEHLEKMNMQAALNAQLQNDEYIKDCLISADKVGVLIQELLTIELWKEKIFPEFRQIGFQPKTTFQVYMALYHEATVVNLLETVMFHREVAESAGDAMFDLIDYIHRKLTYLATIDKDLDLEEACKPGAGNPLDELDAQNQKMEFDISVKAMSLINCVADHLSALPLSVMTRVLNTLDMPVLLVQLVEHAPWTRRKKRQITKYIDCKWKELSFEDSLKLTKTEGQIWLAIYQLLMKEECIRKYELSDSRKNSILRLRSHLTEVMLDQLPVMVEVQRYLEQLSMMEPPAAQTSFILEQVPEIRDNLLKSNEGKWKAIAKKQAKSHFEVSPDTMRQYAKRLADTYNMEQLEGVLTEAPKCAVCGNEAPKRCSKCRNEWYCRRECQVQHWPKHKKVCKMITDALKAATDAGDK